MSDGTFEIFQAFPKYCRTSRNMPSTESHQDCQSLRSSSIAPTPEEGPHLWPKMPWLRGHRASWLQTQSLLCRVFPLPHVSGGFDPVMTCLNISIALTLRRPALEKAMLFIFILNFGWSTANAVKFNFWIHEKRYTMPVLPCHHSMCVNISGWNQRQIPNDNFANHSKMESAEIFGKGFLFLCLEPWGKLYL